MTYRFAHILSFVRPHRLLAALSLLSLSVPAFAAPLAQGQEYNVPGTKTWAWMHRDPETGENYSEVIFDDLNGKEAYLTFKCIYPGFTHLLFADQPLFDLRTPTFADSTVKVYYSVDGGELRPVESVNFELGEELTDLSNKVLSFNSRRANEEITKGLGRGATVDLVIMPTSFSPMKSATQYRFSGKGFFEAMEKINFCDMQMMKAN
ncbi:hypothetical protein [Deinococcus radiophilus]|uniref:hypothetical protein n=1 Tax=Deinococcus radiophilus TaxID=32062 RepID=UPI0026DA5387